jgi:hypothetical protein
MSVTPVSRRLVLAGALSIAAWNLGALEGGEAVASSPTLRWLSGAGDPQPDNIGGGGFGTWRGESTTFARIWADASLKDMGRVWMMDSYKSSEWAGTLDIACGGPREGQTWQSAATGGMDSTWRATCRSVRRKWGKLVGVQLSMAHEMNGSWYPWSVTSATVDDFKKAWARWHDIVNEELVEKGKHAKICLSMNANTTSEVSVRPTPSTLMWLVATTIRCGRICVTSRLGMTTSTQRGRLDRHEESKRGSTTLGRSGSRFRSPSGVSTRRPAPITHSSSGKCVTYSRRMDAPILRNQVLGKWRARLTSIILTTAGCGPRPTYLRQHSTTARSSGGRTRSRVA